jgi:hypothetical protein
MSFSRRDVPPLDRYAIIDVFEDLNTRFNTAVAKNNKVVVSAHEAYGFVAEEVMELLHAIHKNDKTETYNELMDVAIAAIWSCISMKQSS